MERSLIVRIRPFQTKLMHVSRVTTRAEQSQGY
jgi:hypothetical protein